jgi:hypothetical protein
MKMRVREEVDGSLRSRRVFSKKRVQGRREYDSEVEKR